MRHHSQKILSFSNHELKSKLEKQRVFKALVDWTEEVKCLPSISRHMVLSSIQMQAHGPKFYPKNYKTNETKLLELLSSMPLEVLIKEYLYI